MPLRAPRTASASGHLSNAESRIEQAISRSVNWFLSAQSQEGYWWGELEADTTLESDYILYLHILGELDSPKTAKLAKYVRDRQLPDGGWNIFYGGPAELNATVKAWVALAACGRLGIVAASRTSPRQNPRTGRPGSDEFLRSLLSRDGRRH